MKSFTRIFLVILFAIPATGCSLIASFQDRIGAAVARYCKEPESARIALREYLNARATPNAIYIACEGDNPDAETTDAN